MATGITGDIVHPGSWNILGLQLPDIGLTEALAGPTSPRNLQGGSALVNPGPTDFLPSNFQTAEQIRAANTAKKTQGVTSGGYNPPAQQQTGGGGGNFMDYYAGWNPEAARADFMSVYGGDINRLAAAKGGGMGSAGGTSIEDLISSAYAPALQALTGIESGLQGSKTSALENVTADYGQGQKTITGEQKELEDALASQGQQLEKSGQSAYSEAIRNLNSLFQTMASRFGAGSSTGGASSEIIGQEFLRNQGNMRQQLESGRQSIA